MTTTMMMVSKKLLQQFFLDVSDQPKENQCDRKIRIISWNWSYIARVSLIQYKSTQMDQTQDNSKRWIADPVTTTTRDDIVVPPAHSWILMWCPSWHYIVYGVRTTLEFLRTPKSKTAAVLQLRLWQGNVLGGVAYLCYKILSQGFDRDTVKIFFVSFVTEKIVHYGSCRTSCQGGESTNLKISRFPPNWINFLSLDISKRKDFFRSLSFFLILPNIIRIYNIVVSFLPHKTSHGNIRTYEVGNPLNVKEGHYSSIIINKAPN
jgi:lipid-A-disaccharide synthase-like uncharacterized protein